MIGYYYRNSRGREVLYVPHMFIVEEYVRKGPKVILNLSLLKKRGDLMQRGRITMDDLFEVDVEQEDLDTVVNLCFDRKIVEAKDYCVDIFDQVANEVAGVR